VENKDGYHRSLEKAYVLDDKVKGKRCGDMTKQQQQQESMKNRTAKIYKA
jgi:hypothetical protein